MKRLIKSVYYDCLLTLISDIKYFLSCIFNLGNRKIKALHNRYKGERCFIVCTGPSLNFEDLDKISGEYSFGMNSILKILDKTKWKPTFYGIQDFNVYVKMEEFILNYSSDNILIADSITNKTNVLPKSFIGFKLDFYGHKYISKRPKYRFSSNASSVVFDGFSITYSLLQLAVYMGFKDIYLIGCDCNYSPNPEKQHFVSSGHVDPNATIMGKFQNGAFVKAKQYCSKHHVNVFNATRGGCLEVFERVNLDSIIGGNGCQKA